MVFVNQVEEKRVVNAQQSGHGSTSCGIREDSTHNITAKRMKN